MANVSKHKKNDLLQKYQSGCRAKFLADSCLVQLTDFVLSGLDKGMHTGMIMMDLKQVFDTID